MATKGQRKSAASKAGQASAAKRTTGATAARGGGQGWLPPQHMPIIQRMNNPLEAASFGYGFALGQLEGGGSRTTSRTTSGGSGGGTSSTQNTATGGTQTTA